MAWENSAFRVRCWRQRGKCRPQYGIPSGTPYAGSGHWGFGCHNPADISIHAPRVGSDPRRAVYGKQPSHFNPRSPCGERPEYKDPSLESKVISIHAPRVGSDLRRYHLHHPRCGFQSTLPVWGATRPAVEKLAEMEFQSTLPVWGATILAQTGS